MTSLTPFVGTYAGHGSWHDSTGASIAYRIRQTIEPTPDGFTIAFTHAFDDGTSTDARFTMTWIAPHLFRVEQSGTPMGHGYLFDTFCAYHLRVGEAFIEASYHASADTIAVFGSSTRNAAGHYIALTEALRRTSS